MLNPKTGKKWKVYMGLPSTGTVVDLQTYVLRELQERYKDEIELVYPEMLVHRHFHDYARNEIVEEFLQTDCDILWFLDSDVTPPKYVLDLITMHGDKWEAAGAAYPIFMQVPGESGRQIVFTAYKGTSEGGMHPAKIPYEGQEFVDGLATGCLMLKREIFERLKKPYFEFKYDNDSRRITFGEDLGFCMKLSQLGIKFFTDYSMVCKHEKRVCLLDLNNYAIEYANKAVKQYDLEARENARKMMEEAKVKREFQKKNLGLLLPQHMIARGNG